MKNDRFLYILMIALVIIIVIAGIVSPIIINEVYDNKDSETTLLKASDIMQYVGGLLTCFGTLLLGYVSIHLNKGLLIQNEKLFFQNKKSAIMLKPKCRLKRYCLNKNFRSDSYQSNVNYYIVYDSDINQRNDDVENISFKLFYEVDGPQISKLKLLNFNFEDSIFDVKIDSKITTDVVHQFNEEINNFEYCFEIFIIGEKLVDNIMELLKKQKLIVNLGFRYINTYKEKDDINMCINFLKYALNENIKFNNFKDMKEYEIHGNIDNVSYNTIEENR